MTYEPDYEDFYDLAYAPDDPKRPGYAEAVVDWADHMRKAERENPER